MCDFSAYAVAQDNTEQTLILENITIARPVDGGLYLKNLFGEEKHYKGRIVEVLFSKNRLIVEPF